MKNIFIYCHSCIWKKSILEPRKYFRDTDYKIENIHLFRNIPQKNLQRIANTIRICEVINATAGEVVLDANSFGTRLYVVLKGALGNTVDNQDEILPENIRAQYLPGECVGEISVLDEEVYSSNISAICDSELLVIEADAMWTLIEESTWCREKFAAITLVPDSGRQCTEPQPAKSWRILSSALDGGWTHWPA